MAYDYEAELEAWRIRMLAKECARRVHLGLGPAIIKRLPPDPCTRVEYDASVRLPNYEDESQEV